MIAFLDFNRQCQVSIRQLDWRLTPGTVDANRVVLSIRFLGKKGMNPIAAVAVLMIALWGVTPLLGQTQPRIAPSADDPPSVSVVVYNAHLMPKVAEKLVGHRGQSTYRARAIGQRLAGVAVLGLCEVFDRGHRSQLIESLQETTGETYQMRQGPERSGRHLINGGLLFLSRYRIVASDEITYRHASRLLTHGPKSDGFAAKGALYCCVQLSDGLQLDCFLTHLESQNAEERSGQVQELCQFIEQHLHRDRIAVLLGDLNIDAGSEEHRDLLSRLQQTKGPGELESRRVVDPHQDTTQPTLLTESADATSVRLDYQLWLLPEGTSVTIATAGIDELADSEIREGTLSDHAAAAASVELTTER